MVKQDYIVCSEKGSIIVETQKKVYGKDIVKTLIEERKRLGLTQQDIADRTGMKTPNVTRVESCKFTPTLDVLERYAMAVGKKLMFKLEDVDDSYNVS